MSYTVGLCLIISCILLLPTPVQLRNCTRALDVVFVLSCGEDTPESDRNLMLTLSQDVIYRLQPSIHGSQIAHVQFSKSTEIVHGLSSQSTISGSCRMRMTGRNLSDAFETTRRLVLNNRSNSGYRPSRYRYENGLIYGDRPEVPDVIVLMIHGLADDKNRAIAEATRVKSEGIRIITVGITNTQVVDQLRDELRAIATDSDDVENLMLVNRDKYATVSSLLAHRICNNKIEAINESLRLVDGTTNTGRLEVYINEEWVTVCSVGWTDINTIIACKQLGFPDGQNMYTISQTSAYHRRIGVANIQCTVNDTSLLQCSHDPLFYIDSNCDHRRDVFLRCLCDDCDDYIPRDTVRLINRTATSGRLEVFSPTLGWGDVCSNGWTRYKTGQVCRQLGFVDEAETYYKTYNENTTSGLFHISCTRQLNLEISFSNCDYTTISKETCSDMVYIRCKCSKCPRLLLQSPGLKDAMPHSTAVFEWRLKHNISSFEILFLSQKNPQILLHVEGGKVMKENTRFKHRIQLINDDYVTVGFNLTDITVADMGIYCLHVPNLLFDSKASLVVADFAVVPDPVVRRHVHDKVVLTWDLTSLKKLRDIKYEVILTTPTTGRLPLDYYYKHWIKDNPHRHRVPVNTDHLHPSVIIDNITDEDAGNYIIDVKLTSSVHPWLNSRWHFATELVVDTSTNTTAIVLGVFLGLSIVVIIGLVYVCRKRSKEIAHYISEINRINGGVDRPNHRQHNELPNAVAFDREHDQTEDGPPEHDDEFEEIDIEDQTEDGQPEYDDEFEEIDIEEPPAETTV